MDKNFQKLLKISAKFAFRSLRDKSPLFCTALKKQVFVNREFWNHLIFTKERQKKEIQERLLIINCLESVFAKGKILSEDDNFIKLILHLEHIQFCVIIQKKKAKLILLSCFIKNKKR